MSIGKVLSSSLVDPATSFLSETSVSRPRYQIETVLYAYNTWSQSRSRSENIVIFFLLSTIYKTTALDYLLSDIYSKAVCIHPKTKELFTKQSRGEGLSP